MKYHLLCTWVSAISIAVGFSIPQYRPSEDLVIRNLYLKFHQQANLFPRSPVQESELVPLDADELNERKQALLQAKVLSKKSPPSTSGRPHSPLSREDEITGAITATSSGSPKTTRPGSFRFKLPEKSVSILSRPQSPQSPRTPEMGFKFPDGSPAKSFSSSNRKASQGSLYQSPVSSPRLKPQGSLYQSALTSPRKSQGSLYQSAENYQWKTPEGSRRQSPESVQRKNSQSLGSLQQKNSQSLGSSHQGSSSQRKPSETSQSGKSGSSRQKLSKNSQMGRMGSSVHKTSVSSQQTRPQSSRSSHSTHTVHTQKDALLKQVQCKAGVKPTICEYCKKQVAHYINVIKRKPTMVTTMGAAGGVTIQSIGTGLDHKPTQIVGGAVVAASLGCLGVIQAYEQDLKQTYAEHHPDEIDPDPDAEKRKYWEDRNKIPHHGSFHALGNMM